jgi:hypothetical protein
VSQQQGAHPHVNLLSAPSATQDGADPPAAVGRSPAAGDILLVCPWVEPWQMSQPAWLRPTWLLAGCHAT